MASAAAQRYFNSFPAGQQAQIRASWGGADLMDEWFGNAVQSGAVGPDGMRPTSEGATGPTSSTGNWTAAQLRDYAGQQGWSEDFQRFNDATLQGWINDYWDPQAMKFRSMRGGEGYFEKPTECPPGMMPSGPNETDPCIGNSGEVAPKGSGGAGGRAGAGAAGGFSSPLAEMLANQGSFLSGYDPTRGDNNPGVQGGVLKGGGLWWAPTPQVTTAPGTPAPGEKGTGGPLESGQTSPGGWIPPGGNLGAPPKGTAPRAGQTRPGGWIPPVVSSGSGATSSTMRGGPLVPGQTSPGGFIPPRQDSLQSVLAPLQAGFTQPQSALGGFMAGVNRPRQTRRLGSWF
jgi:hypothetical protein